MHEQPDHVPPTVVLIVFKLKVGALTHAEMSKPALISNTLTVVKSEHPENS